MSDCALASEGSPIFEWAAGELARRSQMSRLEARGTFRLALREAGLTPEMVRLKSMVVVIERVLPALLARRGVRDSVEFCRAFAGAARGHHETELPEGDTPEKVFSRFDGGRSSLQPPPSSRTWPTSGRVVRAEGLLGTEIRLAPRSRV